MFITVESFNAVSVIICYQTFISTSTPLGSSSFIRASTVFDEELPANLAKEIIEKSGNKPVGEDE